MFPEIVRLAMMLGKGIGATEVTLSGGDVCRSNPCSISGMYLFWLIKVILVEGFIIELEQPLNLIKFKGFTNLHTIAKKCSTSIRYNSRIEASASWSFNPFVLAK
ncbi:hypothetical protein CSV69_03985 [Sporosarcina sp. P26b]|nr:hypothetical protein SporoP32a_02005 [Sporosarcina ureae]PIC96691.1 hypothetical protein CSV69_03985 [Sporosarcina sp. P26b]